jgi:predicted dehydrogenase
MDCFPGLQADDCVFLVQVQAMRILIAGLGSIGRRHLRNLKALGETDLVLYRTHHATLPDDELAGLPVETDLRSALGRKPDAVIVANPTALHLDIALPAAEMGCAILMEKPLSHSLARVDELVEIVGRYNARILMGFQFRFHPALVKAAGLLKAGAIGRLLSVRAHWGEYLPGWHPWEDYKNGYAARPDLGGGVTLTLSHPLDYLRWLCGDVDALWAFTAASNLGLPVEDTAEIGLHFAGGAVGSVHVDYNQRPPAHRLEIVGSQGSMQWENGDGVLRLFQVEKNAWEAFPPPEGFDRNGMFISELRHFLAVARRVEEPRCTLDDGKWALELALAALESARNQTIIRF